MCFGFLGIQFGFALQNANVSRIFQTLGASIDQIPLLWIAAPLTGLIVQPIVGYYSDRTWTRLGRRRPYFLAGAILASVALVLMPHSPDAVGRGRAAVDAGCVDQHLDGAVPRIRRRPAADRATADRLRDAELLHRRRRDRREHAAVAADARGREQPRGRRSAGIPDTVHYSFYLGAIVLFAAVGWTVLRSREYPPEALRSFADAQPRARGADAWRPTPAAIARKGLLWTAVGVVGVAIVRLAALDPQLYILCAAGARVGHRAAARRVSRIRRARSAASCTTSRRCRTRCGAWCPVQFFSWLALFAMWIYTTPRSRRFTSARPTPQSDAYNEGANWVGVLFGAYNGFAALAAVVIPFVAARVGLRVSPPDQSLPRRHRADLVPLHPRSVVAAARDGRRRLRLGVDPVACPTRCSPTACRRRRWACTWASSISSS